MRTSFLLLFLFIVGTVEAGRPQPFADKDFVLITPGEFQMGCTIGDSACNDYEKPVHPVRITQAFQVQSHQVTERQLKEVTGHDLIHF
jgi:formylglycine-generating enzyme required for sulfatase activity